jgi:hypothetical protein
MARRFSIIKAGLELALLVGVVAVGLNYQYWWDQYALVTFKPAASMAAIENRLALTPFARGVLYRTQPQIDNKANFNRNCQTNTEQLELGCYISLRIFVLNIENPSLTPEMDVVTAHELLHAAWARLSPAERNRLEAELQRVYARVADDDLRERMAGYAKTEPGEQANELHSILATEYTQLSPTLEQYYQRYFTNRAKLVAAHAAYQSVFDGRRQELEAELATIRELKGQLGSLNRQMEGYRSAGQITQYNALVPRQNKLVERINGLIDHYQAGVDEYNALSRSLDSQQITETEPGVE